MKHKLINFLLATALLFSSACSDEDWRGGGSIEEYIEIGEITVNETPQSRAHDNSDNWIWVANEKIIVSAYDKDGKFLASGTYRRNMENTAWSSDSPLARVGVTYKVTTTVPTAEEINSQNDAYNYVLSDYLESTSALLDDKGVLTATLAHQTVDVVAVVTKGAGWESDEAFYEGLSGYSATFYADRDYTVKGLAVAGNDESVDYNDNATKADGTSAGLAPGKKTYIFRAHIDAAKLAAAYGGDKTALLYLEDASGMKLPGTYTRPDGVENGKRLKVTLTLNAPSPSAVRSAEKEATALKCGVAVVEPWLGRSIPSTLWDGSGVTKVIPEGDIYTITTAAELAWVAQETNTSPNTFEGKIIKLANDISLGGQPWTPIAGEFKGTLDGDGFTISGLNVSVESDAGLFETIGTSDNPIGIVKNLGVIGSVTSECKSTYEGYNAGGIAGKNYGTIQNCYTSVTVTCNPSNDMCSAGGIAGNNLGTIQDCYTTGAVTCEKGYAGGIAGSNANNDAAPTIQYCYATGAIKGNQAGGITGNTSIGGSILNCIALNDSINGKGNAPKVGRITGYRENYVTTLTANHAALSIPNAWTGKGAGTENGDDLTEDNFTGKGAGAGAFTGWIADNWDFSTTPNLPILRGFKTDQPVNDKKREPFLLAPVTTITDQKGLAAIKSNLSGSYKLGNDITLEGDWTPLREFKGTLDGCGFVISGLKVSVMSSNAGLFETIGTGGIVKNLGVTDGSVTATYASAGSIAGENSGTIQNCYTNVTVTVSLSNNAGGIAGKNTGTIQNCYTTGAITSENGNAGGIAGANNASKDANTATIQYCYATGVIKGYRAGGISGNMSDKGQIQNCIALNDSIEGNSDGFSVGRILGSNNDGTLANNHAALSIPGVWEAYYKGADKENGADLPSSFGRDEADTGVFAGWKATDWNIETIYIPFLQGFKTANQPVNKMERKPFLVVPVTTIKTQAELAAIKDNLAGSYKLGGSITLTGNWTPLGNEAKRFTGTLDGCGFTISGLNVSMTASTSTYAGLFGTIDKDGTVKNLGVTGSVTVTTSGAYSYAYVGGIAGESAGKITNCYTNVTVSATSKSFIYAGGIVGHMSAKTAAISNCFATGDCIATGTGTSSAIAGGILGSTLNTGSISYCFATGTIEAKGATSFKYAGGIAGQSGTTMTGCIALNKGITGASDKTNRIAGNHLPSTITNCYASPAIPGTWSEIGATKKDGADLTSANFITSNDAFTGWVPNDWRLGDNWQFEAKDFTNLPTLLTTGLIPEDIPLAGQTALARESFLMLIKTKAQLIAFRDGVNATPNDYKGKTIVLAADIDLGNENWTPIGKSESTSFMGTFDGGGHRISGLTVTLNGSSAQYGGLFGYIGSGGRVKNLGVSGGKVDVTSPEFAYAGGIAAKNIGQIENCYTDITVKVSAIYAHAGGIAGLNGVDSSNRSSISNCYAVGNVASSYYSGGIAGWSVWGSISNCFATGKVDGKNAAGGITTQSSQSVSNCIALNTGGITCTNANGKCRISYENKESYASPLIPGTWSNAAMDGTSLAWNNYMTAVGKWPSASWSNTKNSAKLPILKGFGTNQPAALLRWVSFLPVK